MKFLIGVLVASVSARYNSVDYVFYEDAECGKPATTITRPIGQCIKEEREGHYRLLDCSAEGVVLDIEFSDPECKVPVLKGEHQTNECHEGNGRSLKMTCGASTDFTPIIADWTEQLVDHVNTTEYDLEVGSKCISRNDVVNRVVAKANGQYCQCVCPHLSPWRCDCSGIASYAWGLPAPGQVTSTLPNYSTRLHSWSDMKPGDIILRPSSHVEVFRKWDSGTSVFSYCGCHNTADGCSCRSGSTTSYWQGAGYYPAKGNMVC